MEALFTIKSITCIINRVHFYFMLFLWVNYSFKLQQQKHKQKLLLPSGLEQHIYYTRLGFSQFYENSVFHKGFLFSFIYFALFFCECDLMREPAKLHNRSDDKREHATMTHLFMVQITHTNCCISFSHLLKIY